METSKLIRLKDHHRRLMQKNGNSNVAQHISTGQKFFPTYEKMVDCSWTLTFTIFLAFLIVCWTLFAVFYWLICFTHGDFEPNHLPEKQRENNFKPCIYEIRGFSSAFLFSMEAQHTVGYGVKAPTDECAEAIFVNALHCILGFVMQGFMAAILFSKMTRPQVRSQTLMFSKKATICPKDEKLCLMFRVGDIRPRHVVDAKVKVFLVKSTKTKEKEILHYKQTELDVQMDGCSSESLFFNWPIVIYHTITNESPLYYLAPADLCQRRFEIMVVIQGTDENTGQVTQARTSYMPNEILWGMQFDTVMKFNDLREEYEVDFSLFDKVLPVNTPLCSAAYNEQYRHMQPTGIRSQSLFLVDFTPRHSLGELPAKLVLKMQESDDELTRNSEIQLTNES